MKKKILIAFLALIGIGLVSGYIIFKDDIGKVKYLIYPINKKYEEKKTTDDFSKPSEIKEKETSTQTVSKLEESKDNEENNKNNDKSNNNISDNSNQNTKDVSKNSNKNITNNNSNTQNNKSNNSNNNPTTVTPKEEAKQKTPWEELGLTEDQYKNQPMYSWEEVDFKKNR